MSAPEVKPVPLAHKAEAALVRAALAIFRALPPASASRLGGGVARTIGPLIPVSKVADRNLQAAMPELDAAARKRIVAEVWENLGSTVAELAQIGNLHETASGPGYHVTGWDENVAPALEPGKPTIFFTGHIGNWEILPPAAYKRGVDVGFMYRAASNSLVNDIILRLREANFQRKVTMFPKGNTGARQAYAHMMRGESLGLLMDQKLDNGISVPFFGRPAMTGPALASFALKFRCPVFPSRALRVGPARLHVIFEPPMALPDSGDKERDVLTMTTDMNNILERWIRETPGAWLWLHRRWPKTPG
ncbi:MAG TPA: lauroyl acyltransferase [Acidocella sp.]|nr:lauroyl acyltransferase [Acidocella sp.]